MPTLYSMVNETENRNLISEMCKFRFRLVHWIDPEFDRTQLCLFTGQMPFVMPSQQYEISEGRRAMNTVLPATH